LAKRDYLDVNKLGVKVGISRAPPFMSRPTILKIYAYNHLEFDVSLFSMILKKRGKRGTVCQRYIFQ